MRIHHITVSAFAKSKDEVARLRDLLMKILPVDAQIDEVAFEPETEGEVFTRELYEVRCKLEKQPEVNEFTGKIMKGLDEYDLKGLLEKVADHVDEDCNLYLRLSKTEAESGNIVLENKDSIHVKFKLAAYPAKKETAVEVAKTLIEDEIH